MVAIYCRVSTEKQEREGYSLEQQVEAGIEWAKSKSEQYEVYKEQVSGAADEKDREEWSRLKKDIENKTIDKVWVIKADRFSRDVRIGQNMHYFLKLNNVQFYVNGKKLDYKDSSSVFMQQVENAVAEKERKDITERMKRGRDKSMDLGLHAHTRMYGYELHYESNGAKKWIVVDEQVDTIKYVFDLFVNKRMSLRQICIKLNEEGHKAWKSNRFSYSKMRRFLDQIAYIGKTINSRGEVIESKVYKRIIDYETFERAQRLLVKAPERSFKGRYSGYLCSGLMRCGNCGERFYMTVIKKRRRDYCYYWHGKSIQCKAQPKGFKQKVIDRIFDYIYFDAMFDYRTVEKIYSKEKKQYEQQKGQSNNTMLLLEKRIKEQQQKKERLVDAIENGMIEMADVAERLREIKNSIEEYNNKILDTKKSLVDKQRKYGLLVERFTTENAWDYLNVESATRREMIRKILDTAVVDGKQINVKLITGKQYKFNYFEWRNDLEVMDLKTKRDELRVMGKIEAIIEIAQRENDEKFFKEKMEEIYSK